MSHELPTGAGGVLRAEQRIAKQYFAEGTMQFTKFGFCVTCALGCILTLGCGGSSTPPANSPDPADEAAMAESHDAIATGHGVEVGMEFEDKGDDTQRRDRTPPPTPTYKPSSKTKQASVQ